MAALWTSAGSCRGQGAPTDTTLTDFGEAYVPTESWRTATPAAAGFDAGRIEALRRDLRSGRYGTVDGVVVVRYGYLVFEDYPGGWAPTGSHTMQSVSKSVTSLLFGILNDANPGPADLGRRVLDVFQSYPSIENVDERKRALTLGNLLEMRTSMDFWEQPYPGSPLDQLNRSSSDWTQFILDRPMTGAPGTTWAYNSGAAILICSAIHQISGERVDGFAQRVLFGPLGITGASWVSSPFDGLPHCGGGLYLRTTDLARIGYLVLRRGRWGAAQIVSPGWIDASTQPISSGPPVFFSNFGSGYGRFWWLFPSTRGGSGFGVIAASGSGGQWLFVVPELDLVVAVTASNGAGLDLLYDAILPATFPIRR